MLLTPIYHTLAIEHLATIAPTMTSQSPMSTPPFPLLSHSWNLEITRSLTSGRSPHQIDTFPSFYHLFQVCSKRFHASRHWNQEYIIFTTPIWILFSIIPNSYSLFKFMYLVQLNKRFFVPTSIELPLKAQKLELCPSFIWDLVSLSYPSYHVISRSSFADRPCSIVSILISQSESLCKLLSYTFYQSPAQERTREEPSQLLRSGVCLIASYTGLKHINVT